MKLNRRRVLGAIALGSLAFWLGSSALVDWALVRRNHRVGAEPQPNVAWANIESHRLTTSDGEELVRWLIRGDEQKGCVLLLHGVNASRRQMLPVMQWLAEARFTTLAITFRCHGDSTGDVNDFGWSARHDVVAAVEFLRQEYPERPIYIVGRSMGAAAAIFAAKELKDSVAGYFLEQPYRDLKSAVWNRLRAHFLPGLDLLAYAGMQFWAPVFMPTDPNEISPYQHVAEIPESVPIVFATGSADRHATLSDVTALFERVQSHAKLVVFEGAKHEALDRNNPQLYRANLFRLLGERQGDHSDAQPTAGRTGFVSPGGRQ